MKIFSIRYAKSNLTKLINRAIQGEEIIIGKGKIPMVRLEPTPKVPVQRRLGIYRGKISIAPDFEDELDEFDSYTQIQDKV